MLIFYRSIPWLVALSSLGAFLIVLRFPSALFGAFVLLLVVTAFLYGQLIDLPKEQYGFWNMLLAPVLLTGSGIAFFLFLEEVQWMIVLMAVVSVLQFIFAEHLFYYFHQPSEYRVYTVERVSLVLYLVTTFLLGSALFGLLILVQVPLWLLAPGFFLLAVYIVYGTLWVSKAERTRAIPYAIIGAFLLTELFVALSFLPVAHTTNAAALTAFLYFFLGITRADLLDRLTRTVFLRYLGFTGVVLLAILATTRWV